MEALVLVGGLGTRLRSIVFDRPKCMGEVAGRPFLEWVLRAAKSQGVTRFVLCTGYMGDIVESYFRDGARLEIELTYSRESESLGTGGALRLAAPYVRGESVLVLNGDSYCRYDINRLGDALTKGSARAALWLMQVDDASRFGAVRIDSAGSLHSFGEKSSGVRAGLISAGVYLLSRDVIDAIPPEVDISLERDVFPRMLRRGVCGVVGEGPFIDIGTPESFSRASEMIAREFPA